MPLEQHEAKALDYGITMAVATLVEAMGMMSENLQRIHHGESIAYAEKQFEELLIKNGCHHNAAVERWIF